MKLRNQIFNNSIFLILFVSVAFSSYFTYVINRDLSVRVNHDVQSLKDNVAGKINEFLAFNATQIKDLSRSSIVSLKFSNVSFENDALIEETFKLVSDSFNELVFIDNNGDEKVKLINSKPSAKLNNNSGILRQMEGVDDVKMIFEKDVDHYNISFAAKVKDVYEKQVGFIHGSINFNILSDFMDIINSSYIQSYALILDEKRNIYISSTDLSYSVLSRYIKETVDRKTTIFADDTLIKDDFFISYSMIADGKLKLLILVPKIVVTSYVKKFIGYVLAINLFVLSIGFIFSKRISNKILFSLEELMSYTKTIAAGNFAAHINIKSFDEINLLGNSFNLMIENIKKLISQRDVEIRDHKITELELDNAKESYRTILDNVFVGVCRLTFSTPGYFLQVNKRIVEIFGFNNIDEFSYLEVNQLLENVNSWKEILKELEINGAVKQLELAGIKKNGNKIVLSFSAKLIVRADGTMLIDGIFDDITSKKEIEYNLKISYDRLLLLNNLLGFSFEVTDEANFYDACLDVLTNVSWLTENHKAGIFIYDPIGEKLVLTAHRNFPEQIVSKCNTVALGVCICGKAALSKNIKFVSSLDHEHDITYDGIGNHGHYCTPILSTKNKELLGILVIYTNSFVSYNNDVAEFLKTVCSIIANIVEKQKAAKDLLETNRILETNEKALKNMLYDLHDAHKDLTTAQDQLFQSEKLASIGHLAAGIAHEINNPIGFISSNLEMLDKYVNSYVSLFGVYDNLKTIIKQNNMEVLANSIEKIESLEKETEIEFINTDIENLLRESKLGIDRIKKIVSDLKNFSRKDADIFEIADLNDILEGVLTIVYNEIKYKAELIKDYGKIPRIQCHSQRLGQVFINILINAAQSIEGKGFIKIKTYNQDKFNYVEIEDSGVGIKNDNIKKVFDPFFTTKPVGQGTGLGLSISYDIIKKLGGDIKIESEVGRGTKFIIILPII